MRITNVLTAGPDGEALSGTGLFLLQRYDFVCVCVCVTSYSGALNNRYVWVYLVHHRPSLQRLKMYKQLHGYRRYIITQLYLPSFEAVYLVYTNHSLQCHPTQNMAIVKAIHTTLAHQLLYSHSHSWWGRLSIVWAYRTRVLNKTLLDFPVNYTFAHNRHTNRVVNTILLIRIG